ncbi:MAG: SUMF1/EgtB/PvdO family nonheme iron enzyme [Deltaproteobacteria bacterium]|nr:SUMF1/EgtB/PvdO family nonheme iron enzyme [Deltaproteobacteria bacterium]
MRRLVLLLVVSALAGCRGESVAESDHDAGDDTSVEAASDDGVDSSSPDTSADGGSDTLVDAADTPADSSSVDSVAPDADAASDAALVPFESAGNDSQCGATRGARMVYVPVAPTFCIDTHEVSAAEYVQFLQATDKKAEPAFCDWNKGDYGSPITIPASALPVVMVDFCDAHAYCAWAGKRLCGDRASDGVGLSDAYANSQWTVACVNGPAITEWSVGSTTPAMGTCRLEMPGAGPAPVGSLGGCVGIEPPYNRVFDMSGNVEEWDTSGCRNLRAGTTPEDRLTIQCGRRGGSYVNSIKDGKCVTFGSAPIDTRTAQRGFRCCKGPL